MLNRELDRFLDLGHRCLIASVIRVDHYNYRDGMLDHDIA